MKIICVILLACMLLTLVLPAMILRTLSDLLLWVHVGCCRDLLKMSPPCA